MNYNEVAKQPAKHEPERTASVSEQARRARLEKPSIPVGDARDQVTFARDNLNTIKDYSVPDLFFGLK